jgi:hypothetical protein
MRLCEGRATDALLLSQISFWHSLNEKTREPRLKHWQNGHPWLVRQHADWLAEIGIKPETARKALTRLEKQGLIIKERHFTGLYKNANNGQERAVLIRINWPVFKAKVYACRRLLSIEKQTTKSLGETGDLTVSQMVEISDYETEDDADYYATTNNLSNTHPDTHKKIRTPDGVRSSKRVNHLIPTNESVREDEGVDSALKHQIAVESSKSHDLVESQFKSKTKAKEKKKRVSANTKSQSDSNALSLVQADEKKQEIYAEKREPLLLQIIAEKLHKNGFAFEKFSKSDYSDLSSSVTVLIDEGGKPIFSAKESPLELYDSDEIYREWVHLQLHDMITQQRFINERDQKHTNVKRRRIVRRLSGSSAK